MQKSIVSSGVGISKGFKGLSTYSTGVRARKRASGSISKLNRWTGEPHENKRAIARTLRQQAK